MHLIAPKCILFPEGLKRPGDPVKWHRTFQKGTLAYMGITAFVVLLILEIVLAVRTCRKKPDKKAWRRDRLVIRAAEVGCILLHIVCSSQKWRFLPALFILAILLVIAALTMLIGRNRDGGAKKASGAIVSCVLCAALFAVLLLPAFLFTDYSGLPVSGQHEIAEASAILIDNSRTDPFEQDGSAREVPVHFYYPADGTEKYPLVVFSHGAFGYYQSNASTYMELASNGYVVVALDHPHHAFFTEDTDGNMILVDQDFIGKCMNLNSVTDPQEQIALFRQWMDLRTADMNYAVDSIKAAVQIGTTDESWYFPEKDRERIQTALRMTDISKIGLMGHSMGGATSVELGRERSDIGAVIDLDGTMLGEYQGVENGEMLVSDATYTVPVLDFNNWESYIDREQYLAEGGRYPNDEVIKHASAGFSTTVRDTKHMDFTDLPLFSPVLGNMLGSGERSTEETMTIVNSLVLSFFDCYLKGEGVFTAQDVY